jgi:hypothetical protein
MMAGFGGETGMREESEYTYPIVDGDEDDSFPGDGRSIIDGACATAADKTSAVNIYEDWAFFFWGSGRCPDIEIKAVFADGFFRDQEF